MITHLILALLIPSLTAIAALECYKCQSDRDTGCSFASLADIRQWDTEHCPRTVTECAVWLRNGKITQRGCKTAEIGIQQIEACRGNSCNDFVFPRNRLQCYQCGGVDCIFLNQSHAMLPCQNFLVADQCYTIVTDLNVTRNYVKNLQPYATYRGCMSDDENSIGMTKCRENRRFCIKGRTNANPAITTTFGCVQCQENVTTATPSMCFNKTEITACQPLVLGHSPDKCFAIMDGDYLARGCLNAATETCNQAGKECHVCARSGCNGKIYRTVKCRKCDSRTDKRCIDDANVYDYGFCMTAKNATEQLGCYRWEEGLEEMKVVRRGCLHTMKDETMKEECKANTSRCKICEGEICNKKLDFQKCLFCDSRTDENCATLQSPQRIPTKTCDNYMDQCYASIEFNRSDQTYFTKRGCLNPLATPCETPNCLSCKENSCNSFAIPKSRFMCHRCDERRDPSCANDLKRDTKFLHYCPKHTPNDECIVVVDENDTKIVRGCKSDASIEEKCVRMEKCHRCQYEMCNKQPKYAKPGLFCIKCRSDGLTSACATGHAIGTSVICRDHVMLGHTEQCYTAIYRNNVVERGCLADNKRIINVNNVKKWQECDKSGCNNQSIREMWRDVGV